MLNLSNTGLVGVLPSWFWNFSSQLYDFDLSRNQRHGRILNISTIGTSQPRIDLSQSLFEGPLPSIPSNVVKLDLSENLFSVSISPLDLCNRMMSLRNLNLAKNGLSGNLPNCTTGWRNLMVINLSHNKLSGTIPSDYFGSMTFLHSLNLRNNYFYGNFPLSLQNCNGLVILDLGENKFGGRIPAWIGTKLSKIRILSLRSNEFQGDITDQLCTLNFLQILDLSCNKLSGPIPKSIHNFSGMVVTSKNLFMFGKFIYLIDNKTSEVVIEYGSFVMKGRAVEYRGILGLVRSLDLSANLLSRHIPKEITSLSSLQSLNLSNNLLTGEIPGNISEMKASESLDFSMNHLSWRIPTSMSTMSFLSLLNLSYNNLTGEIPSGTQLQTFDESSYIGNSLCGPPLSKNCTSDGNDAEKKKRGPEDYIDMSCFYMGMGIGFAAGFWGVCGALFWNRRWRHCYFRLFDCMNDHIYVAWGLTMRWFHEKLRSYRHTQ